MRWLLTTWGSRGDLHPFLALGQGLLRRGHEVTLVGCEPWRDEVEGSGLRFASTGGKSFDHLLREHPQILSNDAPALKLMLKTMIEPGLAPACDTLLRLAPTHDVLVAIHFVYPASVVAELTGIPWATVTLAPGLVPSASTPLAGQSRPMPRSRYDRFVNRAVWAAVRFGMGWALGPSINRLRRSHGLKPMRDAFGDRLSRRLNLQLYSEHFAPRPKDWSSEKKFGGFCFHDPPVTPQLTSQIEHFLAQGEPPILFTLGTAVMQSPGQFYRAAIAALEKLKMRGILLLGRSENRPAHVPHSVLAIDYAPFHVLMPRVCAVVHQCGIGTLSHVLRAGRPSLACPCAFDQFNNGRRLEALGVAEFLGLGERTSDHICAGLDRLLKSNAPARANQLGQLLRREDGVAQSCDALEKAFKR